MSEITLTLTNAGLAALAAANQPAADPVVIVEMGLTEQDFAAAPTLIALPGEFRRIAVSGLTVDANRIHLTAEDAAPIGWTAHGIGLWTSTGVLLAVYHHNDVASGNVLMIKAAPATALIPVVFTIEPSLAALITFENVNLVYPPASEAQPGVARIATQARVDAAADIAEDAFTFVTPKTLRQKFSAFKTNVEAVLAAFSPDIAAYQAALNASLAAITGRTITGTGLLTGGGDLTASREINLAKADTAETLAMLDDTKAVTPASLTALVTNILADITALSNLIFGRTITTEGLLTGGGDLSANRTFGVAKASVAEAKARVIDTKAVTPAALAGLYDLPVTNGAETTWREGPFLFKKITGTIGANTQLPILFAEAFPNGILFAEVSGVQAGFSTDSNDPGTDPGTWSAAGLTIHGANNSQCNYAVLAKGW